MNRVFFNGRLKGTPKILGSGDDQWGLIKFWHKDGDDPNGNPIMSYRTVYCHASTIQYLLDRGWDDGDEIFVEGSEKIVINEKDGKTYTNVIIYNASVNCGLKKGDTLGRRKSEPVADNERSTPAEEKTQKKETPENQEPRSIEELEEFDEDSFELD